MASQPPLDLMTRIMQRIGPEQIWLFGSRARGDARSDSDWDLLLVMPDDAPERALDPAYAWRVVRDLRIPVDLVPIRRSDFEQDRNLLGTLSRIVVQEGEMLHGA